MNKTTTRNNTSPFLWCDINKSWTEKKAKKEKRNKKCGMNSKRKEKGEKLFHGRDFFPFCSNVYGVERRGDVAFNKSDIA